MDPPLETTEGRDPASRKPKEYVEEQQGSQLSFFCMTQFTSKRSRKYGDGIPSPSAG
ncbi:hypothetical protein [Thermostichus sp. OS-CIW-26]